MLQILMQNNQNIFDFVLQFLDNNRQEWTYERLREETVLILEMEAHNGIKFRTVIDVKENEKIISVYSIFSMNVVEEKRNVMAEFVARLNYALVLGNFEFDFEDGEVRFKNSCKYEGLELSYEFLDNLIMTSIITLDKASKYIVDVLLYDVNPKVAYDAFRADCGW